MYNDHTTSHHNSKKDVYTAKRQSQKDQKTVK